MIVDDDVVTDEEKKLISEGVVYNSGFPFYHSFTHKKFKYDSFVHILIKNRFNEVGLSLEDRINSHNFYIFYNILKRFCDKHNIVVNEICRAALNVTFSIEGLKIFDPHVDHEFDHNVFIIYLNDLPLSNENNYTVIYNEKFSDIGQSLIDNSDSELLKKLSFKKQVYPKLGRCLYFKGNYHAIKNPIPNYLRYVCIMTFV